MDVINSQGIHAPVNMFKHANMHAFIRTHSLSLARAHTDARTHTHRLACIFNVNVRIVTCVHVYISAFSFARQLVLPPPLFHKHTTHTQEQKQMHTCAYIHAMHECAHVNTHAHANPRKSTQMCSARNAHLHAEAALLCACCGKTRRGSELGQQIRGCWLVGPQQR